MTINRVRHGTIPVSDFKPDAAKDYRPKVLRWFKNEHILHPNDCSLRVEDELDGEFVLWADFSFSLPMPSGAGLTGGTGNELLVQTIVDKIEVSPNSNLTHGCDFVIFEDSPIFRKFCLQKGQ
jgi:hypothetical protein